MEPVWDELEKETPSVEFIKVESVSVPSDLGITGFPKFMKIEGGEQVSSVDGEVSKDELKSKLLSVGGGRRRRSSRLQSRRRKHTVRRSTRRRIPLRRKLSSTRKGRR